jgi:hypothetical protein
LIVLRRSTSQPSGGVPEKLTLKLTTARLCLNCDEVHDARACPVCVSETFVYLTRWVPRSQPESGHVVRASVAATAPPGAVNGGRALNPIAVGLYHCFRRAQSRMELMALGKAGELR